MKMYMGYFQNFNEEEAVLIFANNVGEAKILALRDLNLEGGFINLRVRQLRAHPWLEKYATSDEPHTVVPDCCEGCELWGQSEMVDGYCSECSSLTKKENTA